MRTIIGRPDIDKKRLRCISFRGKFQVSRCPNSLNNIDKHMLPRAISQLLATHRLLRNSKVQLLQVIKILNQKPIARRYRSLAHLVMLLTLTIGKHPLIKTLTQVRIPIHLL